MPPLLLHYETALQESIESLLIDARVRSGEITCHLPLDLLRSDPDFPPQSQTARIEAGDTEVFGAHPVIVELGGRVPNDPGFGAAVAAALFMSRGDFVEERAAANAQLDGDTVAVEPETTDRFVEALTSRAGGTNVREDLFEGLLHGRLRST